jgi:hypothetical protein
VGSPPSAAASSMAAAERGWTTAGPSAAATGGLTALAATHHTEIDARLHAVGVRAGAGDQLLAGAVGAGYPSITCVVGSQLLRGAALDGSTAAALDGSTAAAPPPEAVVQATEVVATAHAAAQAAAATTTRAAAGAAAVPVGASAGSMASMSPSSPPRIRVSVLDWPTLIRRRMAARAAGGAGAVHA